MKEYFEKFVQKTDAGGNVVYVFIDASNLWQAQKAKGRFLDYEKTLNFIKQNFKASLVKVFYYTAYPADGTRNYSLDGKHRFFTFLKKGLGFEVRKKELKRINIIDEYGESIKEKGDMDVEITIDAIHYLKKYHTAIFFTGDSDFLALVSYLKRNNKKVFIFSSRNNISEELRTGGDGYSDVLKIDNIWGRELKYRKRDDK
ncbi:NYN domain-containing protein [Patescibacteria group bacterium]|nr:NYN domain-containing protein [Patescibacteria group bacterium]MBU4467102.1 NYN domain-containing protein [Patescibacteria group bacterium]MCG2699780.1 NYN domain-containing protein [Candidatus Parcubacteria bacterium]